MAEITVPVTIGKKVDVTKRLPHSENSALFVNSKGQAHIVPENMATGLVKSHRGHIIDKIHKDYMKLFKMAVGYDEKIHTEKFSQTSGKVEAIEDAGRVPILDIITKADINSEKEKKNLESKK